MSKKEKPVQDGELSEQQLDKVAGGQEVRKMETIVVTAKRLPPEQKVEDGDHRRHGAATSRTSRARSSPRPTEDQEELTNFVTTCRARWLRTQPRAASPASC